LWSNPRSSAAVAILLAVATVHAQPADQQLHLAVFVNGRSLALLSAFTLRPNGRLTELEVQIVQHLSEGHTIGEIAKRVHLSSHTVKDRLAKIRAKLAARSRTGIVAEAMRRGLI